MMHICAAGVSAQKKGDNEQAKGKSRSNFTR